MEFLAAPLILIFLALAVGIVVFEIMMFLDVLRNNKLSETEKIIWAVGMFLFHPFIAIVYYFVAHSRLPKIR